MCMLISRRHTIRVDVKVFAQNAHLEERCVEKSPVDTALRQICSEILRVYIFQIDVQGNTQSRHLQDRCAGKHPEYTSFR